MSIPTPKFEIGQKVWLARYDRVQKELPCPDCLGTRKWKLTTPAGEEFDVTCKRCQSGYNNLPSLETVNWVGTTRQLTIGSVCIDTSLHSSDKGEMVSYMCCETGVGSGNIYRESSLFMTEEEATTAGVVLAAIQRDADHNKETAARNRRSFEMAQMHLSLAVVENSRKTVTDCTRAYRWLRDDLEELIGKEEILEETWRDQVQTLLEQATRQEIVGEREAERETQEVA